MRVSPPGSTDTVLTSSSSTPNTLNSYNSGMNSLPPFSAAKNGVQQVRTASPVTSQQQGMLNDWSTGLNEGYGAPTPQQPTLVLNSQLPKASTPVAKQLTTLTTVNKIPQPGMQQSNTGLQNNLLNPTSKAQVSTTQPMVTARPQQGGAVQLASGITIPPGMVLARHQNGQLLLVSSNSLSSSSTTNTSTVPVTQTATSGTVTTLKNSTTAGVGTSSPQPAITATTAGQVVARTVVPVTNSINLKAVAAKQTVAVSKVSTTSPATTPQNSQSITLSQEDVVNVSKCRNFLTTLIKLASAGGQSMETVSNVKKLVQNLIDDKIEPEFFTQQLQIELHSAPQPYLVPFLKRSLPLLRLTMMQQSGGGSGQVPSAIAVAALRASSAATSSPSPTNAAANSPKPVTTAPKRPPPKTKVVGKKNSVPDIRLPRVSTSPNQISYQRLTASPNAVVCRASLSMPPPSAVTSSPRTSSQKWASPSSAGGGGGGGTFKDDDDINDVASMAGVNLSEESARILATNSGLVGSQIRSCSDTTIVNSQALRRKLTAIVSKNPHVHQIHPDVINFTARAVETRIKDLIEKVSLAASHRISNFRETDHYEAAQDVKSQLKFVLQLDQLEKKRHAQSEREVLMRAMKSRSKNEDPEQLRLKQRAKEMQQLEMERMQIRNADETALNAIGPRKKKAKIESTLHSGLSESKDVSSPLRSSSLRPRIKRVNVKDLIFVLEQEKDTSRSKLLYKSYLK
ncbi:transcription initiation factor TFIID subunit 4-like [Styela clava]|uniref:transcription initiation factor TFIID subunit 4-like n=1 Tax=Styela clava TaxID=7725 RepID=UPI00193A1006|nr:transcription initiation factor TFIID subunit 4-like [Styela clava]